MTDNDSNQDDVLNELKVALDEAPSREFAAGVRARVAQSQARSRLAMWGLAAAATVTLATVALWRPSAEAPAPAMVSAVPNSVTAPAIPNRAPETVAAVQRPARVVTRTAVTSRPAAQPTRVASTEPRLEVITNQAAVLQALWADYQKRPLVVAEAEHVVEDLSTKAIEVSPLVVPPIIVSELGKPAGSGGATPIIRRADATRETK